MKRKVKFDYARWIFVLPALLVVGILLVYPIFSSLYYSMTTKHLIKASYDFIGLENYKAVLSDSNFYKAFLTSILWTVGSLLGQLFIGFTAALAINRVKIGKGIYRTLGIPLYCNRTFLEMDTERCFRFPSEYSCPVGHQQRTSAVFK